MHSLREENRKGKNDWYRKENKMRTKHSNIEVKGLLLKTLPQLLPELWKERLVDAVKVS